MAFKEIKIERFRGINQCEIKNLAKRVNLFVGRNNCGKTSVLDAVFLLSGISNAEILFRINYSFRNLKTKSFEELIEVNFYKLNLEKDIQLSSLDEQNSKRELNIKTILNENDSAQISLEDSSLEFKTSNKIEKKVSTLEYKFQVDTKSYKAFANIIKENKDKKEDVEFKIDKSYNESIICAYLNTRTPFSTSVNELTTIVENKQTAIIVDALQQIDPQIQNLTVVGEKIMVDLGGEKLLPIEIMGDGIRRVLAIVTGLYYTQDGILLIDEIDNGMHHTSMNILWKTILHAAERFNVQIFATTHNIDSLKALKTTLESDEFADQQENTNCFRLRRMDNDVLKAYCYDYAQFEYAIDSDLEIR